MDRSNCTAPRHGTVSDYRYGCRCDDSREAYRLYRKRLRQGRHQPRIVPAIGTVRRLRALAAIGWNCAELSRRLGYTTPRGVQSLREHRSDVVLARVATRVSALYGRLEGTAGVDHRARLLAVRRGWAPPLAWNNIDDPLEQPAQPAAEKPDRPAEVLWLVKGGVPLEEALPRVGMTLASWDRLRWRRGAA